MKKKLKLRLKKKVEKLRKFCKLMKEQNIFLVPNNDIKKVKVKIEKKNEKRLQCSRILDAWNEWSFYTTPEFFGIAFGWRRKGKNWWVNNFSQLCRTFLACVNVALFRLELKIKPFGVTENKLYNRRQMINVVIHNL